MRRFKVKLIFKVITIEVTAKNHIEAKKKAYAKFLQLPNLKNIIKKESTGVIEIT